MTKPKPKLKVATATGRWQTSEPNLQNFSRGGPVGKTLLEVFAKETREQDARADGFMAELLGLDRPEQRKVSLPEEWPCETYDEQKPTKMIFPVGPDGTWTLDLRTMLLNCGMWAAMVRLTVPLMSKETRTLNSIYDVSVNGAVSQSKAIEAAVAAARIAGFIEP